MVRLESIRHPQVLGRDNGGEFNKQNTVENSVVALVVVFGGLLWKPVRFLICLKELISPICIIILKKLVNLKLF